MVVWYIPNLSVNISLSPSHFLINNMYGECRLNYHFSSVRLSLISLRKDIKPRNNNDKIEKKTF